MCIYVLHACFFVHNLAENFNCFMLNSFALLLFIWMLMQSTVFGNDIKVSNVSLINQNIEEAFTEITFDIEWQNSWRYDYSSGINNWDAAWVYIKFRAGIADPVLTGVNSTGNLLTLNSTEGLRAGMPLLHLDEAGGLSSNTIITSINSDTSITVSHTPDPVLQDARLRAIRTWEHACLDETGYVPGTWFGDGNGHVILEPGLSNHNIPFDASNNPVVGVFLYRSETGFGEFSTKGVTLRWNYGKQGINNEEIVDIRVFAIEMVYVPAGSFYIGSGGTEVSAFYKQPHAVSPYKIASEGIIHVGTSDGMLYYEFSNNAGDQSGPIPEHFPKGYAGFYCMKYNITQQQYVDFLNSLTRRQQDSRFAGSELGHYMFDGIFPGSITPRFRNGVRIMAKPEAPLPYVFGCDLNMNHVAGETDDGQYTAMNYLNFRDAAAFADWAGLRPMTELEFEKAARGNMLPVPDGYAWGTDKAVGSESTADGYMLINAGQNNESVLFNGNEGCYEGNSVWSGTARSHFSATPFDGPTRVGIFATSVSNRIKAGSSYWGIMELSGNVSEWVISTGNNAGRSFSGNHGDGMLNASGNANENTWPISPNGFGMRGGSFFHHTDLMRISDRRLSLINPVYRSINTGARAIRTRPCLNPQNPPGPIQGAASATPESIESFTTSGGSNYLWIVPDGYEIVSGQGTNTIDIYTGQQTGTIRVAIINECGAGPEQTKTIQIN